MEKLLDCTLTTEAFGLYTTLPLQRFVIFKAGVKDLCGFEDIVRVFTDKDGTEWVEVQVFLKLIYDCYPVPNYLLNIPKENIDYADLNFLKYLSEKSGGNGVIKPTKDFVYKNCINLQKFINQNKRKKDSEYDFFKTCFEKCMLSEFLRKLSISGEMSIEKKDFIQSLQDNHAKSRKLDFSSVKNFITNNVEEALASYPNSQLNEGFSITEMNDILLEIRNIR